MGILRLLGWIIFSTLSMDINIEVFIILWYSENRSDIITLMGCPN